MSRTDQDLDLTKVETSEHTQLAQKIESYYMQDSTTKLYLAYHWERNHLYLDGQQWITHDTDSGSGRQWSPLRVHAANQYIPRPVTNFLYSAYQTLKSYLTQHRPRSSVHPKSQLYRDKAAAKIAELVLECNWERLKEDKNYEYAAANALVYGTVFKKTYWDTTTLQKARIPRLEERATTDPETGQPTGGVEEVEVVDPESGEIVYDEVSIGDVSTEVVEPYRVTLDPLASDVHDCRWIMEAKIVPLNIAQQLFDKQEPGYTGEAKDLKNEKQLSNSLRRFYELKTSSGGRGTSYIGYTATSGTDEMIDNAVVLKEYYEQPSEEHPKGRMIVVASGKTLYAGPSPYEGPEMGDWHPFSEFRWEIVPGRFWGKSPFDDAIEPQKRINSIDSAIVLTRKTMAIPQKLVPKGSGIKRNDWTGRPGQIIEYKPGVGKPETIVPVGVDTQLWQERQQCVDDIKDLTGAIDILKGERPPSVSAASALELLYEVGTGKLRPALDRWKFFVENDQKKQLKLTSRKYREPREQFIQMLHSKNREVPPEMIDNFIGADLHDNCNVVIEAGSNVPKLQSAHRSRLMEAAQVGSLQLETPENRLQFNEDMGISGYDQDVGPDVKRAQWENDLLDTNDPNKPAIVLQVDEHALHNAVHSRRMKEPSFMSLQESVQQAYMKHMEEHQEFIERAEQEQMMAQMQGQAQPAPQDMTQPGPNLPQSGTGAPTAAAEAIAGADLPPDAKARA